MNEPDLSEIISLLWPWVVLIAGVTSGIVTFAFKTIVAFFQRRSIEKYTADLKRDLQRHQIEYSQLHAVRAEKVQDLHRLIAKVMAVLQAYRALAATTASSRITAYQDKESELLESYQLAIKTINKTEQIYLQSRLYFCEKLCESLDDFFEKLKSLAAQVDATAMKVKGDVEYSAFDPDSYEKVIAYMEDEVAPLKQLIEKEFRELLGT